jgi:hypothetical protein
MRLPSKREVFKSIVGGMTSNGVKMIVDGVVDNNVERENGVIERACLWMASAAIGVTISAACKVQTDLLIDSVLDYRSNRHQKKL